MSLPPRQDTKISLCTRSTATSTGWVRIGPRSSERTRVWVPLAVRRIWLTADSSLWLGIPRTVRRRRSSRRRRHRGRRPDHAVDAGVRIGHLTLDGEIVSGQDHDLSGRTARRRPGRHPDRPPRQRAGRPSARPASQGVGVQHRDAAAGVVGHVDPASLGVDGQAARLATDLGAAHRGQRIGASLDDQRRRAPDPRSDRRAGRRWPAHDRAPSPPSPGRQRPAATLPDWPGVPSCTDETAGRTGFGTFGRARRVTPSAVFAVRMGGCAPVGLEHCRQRRGRGLAGGHHDGGRHRDGRRGAAGELPSPRPGRPVR